MPPLPSPANTGPAQTVSRPVTTLDREERKKKKLRGESGFENGFGFYCDSSRKEKTPWLMQEFTSDMDRGAGRKGVPALHKLYVTPRPEGLREIYGEDGLTAGNKKPVPADYFTATATLMPPGCVRVLRQEQDELTQASNLPPSLPASSSLRRRATAKTS